MTGSALIRTYHRVDADKLSIDDWARRVNEIIYALKCGRNIFWSSGEDNE